MKAYWVKIGLIAAVFAIAGTSVAALGCARSGESGATTPSGEVSVYTREDGSGTKAAFDELLGIESVEDGELIDRTTLSAAVMSSSSAMQAAVAADPNAVGFVSVGALTDNVKPVRIDGVEATEANVADGGYGISRPFNLVVTDGMSDAARDFVAFVLSADGQAVVVGSGYIPVAADAGAYTPDAVSGKVIVAGSSSVGPLMQKLVEAYQEANPAVRVEIQQSESTAGTTMQLSGMCDLAMVSRGLTEREAGAGLGATTFARDGIAVIVNPSSQVDGLTSDQVKRLFTGVDVTWEQVMAHE